VQSKEFNTSKVGTTNGKIWQTVAGVAKERKFKLVGWLSDRNAVMKAQSWQVQFWLEATDCENARILISWLIRTRDDCAIQIQQVNCKVGKEVKLEAWSFGWERSAGMAGCQLVICFLWPDTYLLSGSWFPMKAQQRKSQDRKETASSRDASSTLWSCRGLITCWQAEQRDETRVNAKGLSLRRRVQEWLLAYIIWHVFLETTSLRPRLSSHSPGDPFYPAATNSSTAFPRTTLLSTITSHVFAAPHMISSPRN